MANTSTLFDQKAFDQHVTDLWNEAKAKQDLGAAKARPLGLTGIEKKAFKELNQSTNLFKKVEQLAVESGAKGKAPRLDHLTYPEAGVKAGSLKPVSLDSLQGPAVDMAKTRGIKLYETDTKWPHSAPRLGDQDTVTLKDRLAAEFAAYNSTALRAKAGSAHSIFVPKGFDKLNANEQNHLLAVEIARSTRLDPQADNIGLGANDRIPNTYFAARAFVELPATLAGVPPKNGVNVLPNRENVLCTLTAHFINEQGGMSDPAIRDHVTTRLAQTSGFARIESLNDFKAVANDAARLADMTIQQYAATPQGMIDNPFERDSALNKESTSEKAVSVEKEAGAEQEVSEPVKEVSAQKEKSAVNESVEEVEREAV